MNPSTAESGKFCVGCDGADWSQSELVHNVFIHTKDGMLRLNLERLPMCMYAVFRAAQDSSLPSRSVAVDHVAKGSHQHYVLHTSHLGARLEGDTCSGNS